MAERGFTLLEVLIAMTILSITFGVLIKAQSDGIDMAQRARFYTTATLLAQEHIAEVVNDREKLTSDVNDGDFGEDYPGYRYSERLEGTPLTGYLKYTLAITWGGEESGFVSNYTTFIATF